MEKSGIVRFSRFDDDGSRPFTYLGFDFYWAKTRRGKKTIKRRTTKKKYQASLKSLKEWVRNHSSLRLRDMKATLRSKFRGHFNYYGVIGNSCRLSQWFKDARWLIYRELNKRSQMTSYNWSGFTQMWNTLDIPNPKIVERSRYWNYSPSQQ